MKKWWLRYIFSIDNDDNDDNDIKQKVSVPVYWQEWEYLSFCVISSRRSKRLPIVSRLPIDECKGEKEKNRNFFFASVTFSIRSPYFVSGCLRCFLGEKKIFANCLMFYDTQRQNEIVLINYFSYKQILGHFHTVYFTQLNYS
jgi:hypothetical protein